MDDVAREDRPRTTRLRASAPVVRAACVALALAACDSQRSTSSRPGETTTPSSVVSTTQGRWATEHAGLGAQLRDAVLAGNESATRAAARSLAGLDPSSMEDHSDRLGAMKSAAAELAAAGVGAKRAGPAAARLAQTCGDCHSVATGPTRPIVTSKPPRVRVMRRHEWAVARLWDGLVFNSDEPWRAGADALRDRSAISSELAEAGIGGEDVDAFIGGIEGIGDEASAASDTGVRAALLGRLLATCGQCHEQTGGGRRLERGAPKR